jgi:hypothetical protein
MVNYVADDSFRAMHCGAHLLLVELARITYVDILDMNVRRRRNEPVIAQKPAVDDFASARANNEFVNYAVGFAPEAAAVSA